MSRGLSSLQRDILDLLGSAPNGAGMTWRDIRALIAARDYMLGPPPGENPTQALKRAMGGEISLDRTFERSLKRALHSLHNRGLVTIADGTGGRGNPFRYVVP